MARASDAQKADRLNRARTLLRQRARPPEAAERLARAWVISKRQACRYLDQAQQLKQCQPRTARQDWIEIAVQALISETHADESEPSRRPGVAVPQPGDLPAC